MLRAGDEGVYNTSRVHGRPLVCGDALRGLAPLGAVQGNLRFTGSPLTSSTLLELTSIHRLQNKAGGLLERLMVVQCLARAEANRTRSRNEGRREGQVILSPKQGAAGTL